MLVTILVVILVLALIGGIGAYPGWSHSASWGYAPFGGLLGLVVIILLIMVLTGNLHV